jgi:hypothetical protein
MHKGRIFRRVLPPALSPNYADNSHAPVFLRLHFQVERGSGFLLGQIDMGPADVARSIGRIQWSGTFNNGFTDFQVSVLVQLVPHSPDHILQVVFVDEAANDSSMMWRVGPGEGRWGPFGDNYFFPGEINHWAPPFGPILTVGLLAITYPNEPPLPP